MNLIGDMAAFQRYQLGHAMPIAAANPAGGLAGAGVGVGMGMAIAGPMVSGGNNPSAPPPPPPTPSWHLVQNGEANGPFSIDQIAQGIAAGAIRPDTMVWTASMTTWTMAAAAPQLAHLFPATPPPPPEQTP